MAYKRMFTDTTQKYLYKQRGQLFNYTPRNDGIT